MYIIKQKWKLQNEELAGEGSGGATSTGTGSTDAGSSDGSTSGGFDTAAALDTISSDLFDKDSGDGGSTESGEGATPPAAKTATDDKPSPSKVTDVAPKPEGADPTKPDTPAPGPNDYPKTWKSSPELQAKWQAMDPELRAEVQRREENFHQGIAQYKADAGIGQAMKQTVAPYIHILNHYRIDPMQLTGQLLKAHHDLSLGSHAQKLDMFRKLAGDYGLSIDEIAAEQPYVDPQVQSLQRENQRLESERQRAAEEANARTHQMLKGQLDTFFGNPKNEFAEKVALQMVPLVKAGAELEDAYQQACWLNPEVRQILLTREAAKKEAEAKALAAKEVEKARAATAANVRTSSRNAPETGTLGSMDDTLKETLRAMKSRD